MSKKDSLIFSVSIEGATAYEGEIVAYVFSNDDKLEKRVKVKDGSLKLPFGEKEARRYKVLLAPPVDKGTPLSPARLRRLGAFEAVLVPGKLIDRIRIPGNLLDLWPFCFCWITGRVLKEGLPVCGARVHLCEVDFHYWLRILPDHDLLRLRDDLLHRIPQPLPVDPPRPRPQPDPLPIPPFMSGKAMEAVKSAPGGEIALQVLRSESPHELRQFMLAHLDWLYPYFCLLPPWWWYDCDDIATVTTDSNGRFSALSLYNCSGDKPDIYAWVEYQIGSVWETVYRPSMACHTHWNYSCGSDIILNISDERVPVCNPEPDLPGSVVAVMSIGNAISISEIQTAGPNEGLARENHPSSGVVLRPLGATLEPRVDFSRSDLIAKGITHYRWSYRRLTRPDGITPDKGPWTHMDRNVYRHYRVLKSGVLSYPSELMGPDPAGPAPNTIRIRPVAVPAGGQEWVVVDQHVDLASGYFETASLPGVPAKPADGEDSAAGLYELKLELFKSGVAQPVEWEAEGVGLKIPDKDAPFGTGNVPMVDAPDYNRIRNEAGRTVAFRMVLRVDNNFCSAEVFEAVGPASPASCGVLDLAPSMSVELGFRAYHPQGFARYTFDVTRGDGNATSVADTSGRAGQMTPGGYMQGPPFSYRKSFSAADLLAGGCSQAAFAEVLRVHAMATNGYSRLYHYDGYAAGAFALATPCNSKAGRKPKPGRLG